MWMKREEQALAKAKAFNAKGDKKSAMQWLKRKKMAEAQVTKTMGMMETAEAQVYAMQGMATNAEHFRAINEGLSTMKAMRERINPDMVDELRADLDEAMADAKEIDEVLGQGLARSEWDQDELDAELAALGGPEEVGASAAAAPVAPVAVAPAPIPFLPEVPTGDIHIPATASAAGPARVAIAAGGAGGGGGALSELEALDAAM